MNLSHLCEKARESQEGSASETRSGDPGVVAMSAHSQHAHLQEAIHKTNVHTFLMLLLKKSKNKLQGQEGGRRDSLAGQMSHSIWMDLR